MKKKQMSYALRGAIGFAVAGILMAACITVPRDALLHVYAFVLALVAGPVIGGLFIVKERSAGKALRSAVVFALVFLLGFIIVASSFALANEFLLVHPTDTGYPWLALLYGITYAVASPFLRYGRIPRDRRMLYLPVGAFVGFAGGFALMAALMAPLANVIGTHTVMFPLYVVGWGVGGAALGFALDRLERKATVASDGDKPNATRAGEQPVA